MRSPASLSRRLIAAASIWVAGMLTVGGVVLALAFRSTVEREFNYRLDTMSKAVAAALEIGPDGSVLTVRPLGDPRFDRIFSGWYWQVTEANGRQVRSRSLWDSAIEPVDSGTELHSRKIRGPNDEPLLVVERDLLFHDNKGPVHVLVAGELREVNEGVRSFDLLLVSSLGLLGIGMALAILVQVRYGLRPLRDVAADLQAVHKGERSRLSGFYPREVAPLASAMNGVLDKDAELIERARSHVGNLAHGLKTSLAIIAAELEGTLDRKVLAERVQVMRRLVEHHLGRASAAAGAGRALGIRVSVREVANGVATALAKVFADKNPAIEVEIAADVAFLGHREDLEEIIGNLAENACKWTKRRVCISARNTANGLVLSIDDDGPGMSGEQAAIAAERGKRLDELAPGWGLGLSIVSDIVAIYGGEMEFRRSSLGGLSVTVRIP